MVHAVIVDEEGAEVEERSRCGGGNPCVCFVCTCDTADPKGLITFELAAVV